MSNVSRMFPNYDIDMKAGYSYGIILRDYINKDGRAALYLRVIIKRKKRDLPLNLYVNPIFFNKEKGIIEKTSGNKSLFPYTDKEASDFNLMLKNETAKATEIFVQYRLSRKDPDLNDFVRQFTNFEQRESFAFFYESELKSRKDISPNTLELHQNTLNLLNEYKPEVKFMDLNLDFINDFNAWLKRNKNHNNNTRVRELRDVHQYILRSINKKFITIPDPFKNFKWPPTTNSIVFLEQHELKQWTDYFYSPDITPAHKRSLRYFLFMCYTSLRVSDAKAILDNTDNMIIDSTLSFVPIKTSNVKGQILRIPLTDIARRFLNEVKGKAIDTISESALNRDLKLIAGILETNKNISSKVGRHTFATVFLERGGSVEVLQQILGHSDIADTMVYVHITNTRKNQQTHEAFNNFHQEKISSEQMQSDLWGHILKKKNKKDKK